MIAVHGRIEQPQLFQRGGGHRARMSLSGVSHRANVTGEHLQIGQVVDVVPRRQQTERQSEGGDSLDRLAENIGSAPCHLLEQQWSRSPQANQIVAAIRGRAENAVHIA